MNILNISIGNYCNMYIDSLKENNSKIKNYYITFNNEEYKYSNGINSFNYHSLVSLDFLLEDLSNYSDYDIFFIFYELGEDNSMLSQIIEFINRINKNVNIFVYDESKNYNSKELKNIINNYNNIVSFLEEGKINNISFINSDTNMEYLYYLDHNYFINNNGYLLLTSATDLEGLNKTKFIPSSLDSDLVCTNFKYEYLNSIDISSVDIIDNDITVFFGLDLPFDFIQEYYKLLLSKQDKNRRKKTYRKIELIDDSEYLNVVTKEEFSNIINDIMNQIM